MSQDGHFDVAALFDAEEYLYFLVQALEDEDTPTQCAMKSVLEGRASVVASGVTARGSFILGIPTETRGESLETIRFSRRLPLDQVRFALATPFPGTALWQLAEREGQAPVEDWMSLSLLAGYRNGPPPYIPAGRGAEELKRLQRSANPGFFFRPRTVQGFVRRIRRPLDLYESALGAWQLARASFPQR